MKIRRAKSSDLSAVERLLTASDLPTDGVRDNFSGFVVADDNGAIAGAIGLEKYWRPHRRFQPSPKAGRSVHQCTPRHAKTPLN